MKNASGKHRSAFKNSAKFRQTFSHFYILVFKISLLQTVVQKLLMKILRNFSNFYAKYQHLLESPINFRNENYRFFQKIVLEKLEEMENS